MSHINSTAEPKSDRPASTKTARDWCFTVNLTNADINWRPQQVVTDYIKYMICQLEEAPDTGFKHYQGYVKFKNAVRLTGAKRILDTKQGHVGSRHGTQDEARDYCLNLETKIGVPYEFGNWDKSKGHGKRTDFETIYQMAKSGKSRREIMEAFPGQYARYHAGIDKMISEHQVAVDRANVRVSQ
jgi:Putative viral replication protein